MESIRILFSFSFHNIDYKNFPFCIIPTKETSIFFSSHSIRFIKRDNKYEAVWFSKNNKNIDMSFSSLFKDVVFNFDVFFENVCVFDSFELEVAKVYLLSNDNDNDLLHSGTFLSSKDCIIPKEYMHHLLARISIAMNKILLDSSNNNYRVVLKKK